MERFVLGGIAITLAICIGVAIRPLVLKEEPQLIQKPEIRYVFPPVTPLPPDPTPTPSATPTPPKPDFEIRRYEYKPNPKYPRIP